MDADIFAHRHIRPAQQPREDAQEIHLCREIQAPSLNRIAEMVRKKPDVIEPGIKVLDYDFFIPNLGEIDFIAASKGNLVVVSTYTKLNADHLGKAVLIKHWVLDNYSIIRHVFKDMGLSDCFDIRIVFLCSDIDPATRLLMSMLTELPLEVYGYRCMEGAQMRWLTLEKLTEDKKAELPVYKTATANKQIASLTAKPQIELTKEEIGDFFKAEAATSPNGEASEDALLDPDLSFDGSYFNS